MTSRRQVLAHTIPAMALAAGAAPVLSAPALAAAPRRAHAGPAGKAITRAEYERYIALYNACDPAFTQFYHDDVVMETVPPLIGAASVLRFTREERTYITETMSVEFYVGDATGSAAQVVGEFRCIRDMPVTAFGGLFGRAVSKGQMLRQRGTLLYGVRDGRFTFIRAAPPIILHDWA